MVSRNWGKSLPQEPKKEKKVLLTGLWVFLFIVLFPHFGQAALDIPRPVGDIYVQDFADVLSQQEEEEIRRMGRTLEDQTSSQVAVLTVPSIGDASIEEYANQAYRLYGLGTTENDNGVLLVLAMNERKIRIEVGYGLEGAIPDGKAGRIIDQYAIPNLQADKPNAAVMSTYQVLASEANGEHVEYGSGLSADTGQEGGIPSWLLIIIVVGLIFLDITFFGGMLTYALLSILSRGGGGGGPRGGGGGSSGGGGASRGW
ncbi:TPM domain-containing protein [Mesobacillus campisalis]|uniref:TPM domain-containing protein n=1 Tax=Mesobacillus campisalis TaxID=1408103 RepID=UPI00069BF1D6|nr:TPM domain-containing protein [Mesobacillus campisalis]